MTHTIEATAWTLIHFCWQAALISGLYRLASIAFARRASEMRYMAALAVLLAMPAAAVLTFAWEMRSPAAPVYMGASSATSNTPTSGDFPRMVAPGILAASDASTPLPSAGSLPNLMGWIDAFWVVGVLALSVRGVGGWWLIHRLRTTALTECPDAVRAAFARLAQALSLRRTVLLRISSAIAGPVTVGALRAMVLLPVSAITLLSPDELEVVLAHELAHVRRADFFWNLVQTVVETLFFFHPAVWWISGRVRHERELCCDDLALKICPNPVVYASALFHLEEHRSRQMRLAMALDGHQSPQTLRMRIARILGESMPFHAGRSLRPFSAAAIFAAVVVLLLPAPHVIAGLRPTPASHAAVVVAQPSNSPSTLAQPSPKPHPASQAPAPQPAPQPQPQPATQPQQLAQAQNETPAPPPANTGTKLSYIDRMKAAGYDVDLDKLIAMKIQGITPEYAQTMAQVGFGKLSADDLIACKIQGVTPEAIADFKKQGLEVKSIQDAISYRIFGVTADFARSMQEAGFKDLDSKKLLALRVQGVTPEYAKAIAQQYPGATVDDVIKTRIFGIDTDFIALAKKHGFANLTLDKLVQIRISGILDDESEKP